METFSKASWNGCNLGLGGDAGGKAGLRKLRRRLAGHDTQGIGLGEERGCWVGIRDRAAAGAGARAARLSVDNGQKRRGDQKVMHVDERGKDVVNRSIWV